MNDSMNQDGNELPCAECGGRCCRHVAIELNRPACKRDYDNIRWFLCHRDVAVYVDLDNVWHILFNTACEFIDEKNRCSMYDDRPKLCRSYGGENELCEFFESPYKMIFHSVGEFEAYLKKQRIDWRWKR